MRREELLREKGYWLAKTQIDFFKQFEEYITKNKINRTLLAKKLGVSKGYVSQVLNGEFDHRISKFFELSIAVGKVPKIEFVDLEQLINEENEGVKNITWKLYPNKLLMEQKNKENLPCEKNEEYFSINDNGISKTGGA